MMDGGGLEPFFKTSGHPESGAGWKGTTIFDGKDAYTICDIIAETRLWQIYRIKREGPTEETNLVAYMTPYSGGGSTFVPDDYSNAIRDECLDKWEGLTKRCPEAIVELKWRSRNPCVLGVCNFALETFEHHMERFRDDVPSLLEDFISLLDKLQAIHESEHVHHDIKPSNILKVVEWKFADLELVSVPGSERPYGIGGTPDYMSPEKTMSGVVADNRSDIYSMGVILYRILTGKKGLPDDSSLDNALKDVQSEFRDVLMSALNPEMEGRYHSCNAFKTALVNAIDISERSNRNPGTIHNMSSDDHVSEAFKAFIGKDRQLDRESAYKELLKSDTPMGQIFQALMSYDGVGVKRDRDFARLTVKSIPGGIGKAFIGTETDPLAWWLKGWCYERGLGFEKSIDDAMECYMRSHQLDTQLHEGKYKVGTNALGSLLSESHDQSVKKKGFEYIKKAAEDGYVGAMYNLGLLYRDGTGTEASIDSAIHWLESAAKSGFYRAYLTLGKLHKDRRDLAAAVDCYKNAADRGISEAQTLLGILYEDGDGVERSYSEAVRLYRMASDADDVDAPYFLAWMYKEGKGVPPSLQEAFRLFEKAANLGNHSAQISLGLAYEYGEGVAESYSKAIECYRNAAEGGKARGWWYIGTMYMEGKGVEQSPDTAVNLFRRAAELGDDLAMQTLGDMYRTGDVLDQSYKDSYEWYMKAAENGCEEAMFNLGLFYEHGLYVDRSFDEAFNWFKKSADNGSIQGQYLVAYYYYRGIGVPRSLEEAASWAIKAADGGNEYAQMLVGHLYENGEGLPCSAEHAYRYYKDAISSYNGGAILQYVRLASKNDEIYRIFEAIDMISCTITDDESQSIHLTQDIFDILELMDSIQSIAESGNACAQFFTGFSYGVGFIVERSPKIAKLWFKKAAEHDDPDILSALGDTYREGIIVKRSLKKAYGLYLKASEGGNATAKFNLAVMYIRGDYVDRSIDAGIKALIEASEMGCVDAQRTLGDIYYNMRPDNLSREVATKWLMSAMNEGDLTSAILLGRIFVDDGCGIENARPVISRLFDASESRIPEAQYVLGRCYEIGWGVEKSLAKAEELYGSAAKDGCEEAKLALSNMYTSGVSPMGSFKEGTELLKELIKNGNDEAKVVMISKTFNSSIEPDDLDDAIHKLRKITTPCSDADVVLWFLYSQDPSNSSRKVAFIRAMSAAIGGDALARLVWSRISFRQNRTIETFPITSYLTDSMNRGYRSAGIYLKVVEDWTNGSLDIESIRASAIKGDTESKLLMGAICDLYLSDSLVESIQWYFKALDDGSLLALEPLYLVLTNVMGFDEFGTMFGDIFNQVGEMLKEAGSDIPGRLEPLYLLTGDKKHDSRIRKIIRKHAKEEKKWMERFTETKVS